jgi:flagellar motor protein MotB
MAMIRSDDRAYRRGVVFGFTVAEVVLLLVFCLLLLFVPFLLGENDKRTRRPTADASYVELPGSPGSSLGWRDAGIGSADAPLAPQAPLKDSNASDGQVATSDDPPLGDPSPANNTAAQAKPLPEGWIRVAPDGANQTSTQDSNRQSPRLDPSAQAAALPFEALPLASACERLGIPAADCAASAVDAKLSALGRHNWPPIIKIKEADGEFFLVGSAQVSPAFEAKIKREVVPRIIELVTRFRTDVVEIVGNTDEQPIPPGIPSNLDTLSIDVLAKGESPARLNAADNAGLGFARALAVVQVLSKDDRLKNLTILPLSAAQVIDVDGKLSNGSKGGDVKERRRIEIRVRQSGVTE